MADTSATGGPAEGGPGPATITDPVPGGTVPAAGPLIRRAGGR